MAAQPKNSSGKPARFDKLTLRLWFEEMDSSNDGHVQKHEWFTFLRANDKLRKVFLSEEDDSDKIEYATSPREQTRLQQRLLRVWREIDIDGNGTLEFEEFVDFFRKAGRLLEYITPKAPPDALADMKTEMREMGGEVDEKTMEQMGIMHLSGRRRRTVVNEVRTLHDHPEVAFQRHESGPGSRPSTAATSGGTRVRCSILVHTGASLSSTAPAGGSRRRSKNDAPFVVKPLLPLTVPSQRKEIASSPPPPATPVACFAAPCKAQT